MKKTLLLLFLFLLAFTSLHAQLSWQGGTNPEENDSATLLFDKTGTGLESYSGTIYAHTGVTLDDTDQWQNVIGTWGSNSTQPALTLVSGNIYELDLTPTIRDFYNNPTGSITSINVVFRSDDGSQQTVDLEISVGAFQVTMINPAPSANGVVIVDNGGGTQILAQNSNGPANYELFANGVSIHTQNNTTFYNGYLFSGLTENQYCELVVTQGAATTSRSFLILVNSTIEESIPSNLEDGINYNDSDPTTATLVIDAPNKDFVYVAGSFNNWEPTSAHAMKKDPSSSKFWVELTGLTSGQIETYQYWVGSLNPIAGSPKLVKTADPYSTLVLSPFDDPWISATTYPNLPAYPEGQEREVTVLETGQTPYAWQVTNFQKPKKEDLIIYEVLVRDFDQDRNFQDLIDKVDYFKDLNVNAIQLMPVMEFEGNESWGYNTSFHMALDKFYGTEEKLKELVDVFHQNGIAVILDIALNHAFGRNPMVRMWMDDPDGDGWGEPSSENPYFNQVAKHSYSVGSDFNHQQTRTQYYVERVVKHWIEEFNIDGFRWDLTKGFTQNCENSDTCTDAPQPDRIAILQQYADYSWSLDPDHYVIFEHLGNPAEEQQWANYRIDEGKGVMMWKEVWNDYKNLAQGNSANINAMGNTASGFTGKRALGYPESHDKDRIMYEMLQFGNSNGGYDVTNLNTALQRMSTIGAVSLTIPGPKMIWHFGELGMDVSIWTCNNGVVNSDYDGNNDGDCKLDTKPQPQWVNNWIVDTNRSQIYNDWARLNELKINEDVFEGNYSIDSGDTTPRIYIWDDTLPSTSLKNVVILANFDVTAQNIVPDFPYTGTWYDLMDDSGSSSITVSSTTATINIPAGEFRIYGNQASTLSVEDFSSLSTLKMFPNPTSNSFKTNKTLDKVLIYNTTGKLIYTFDGGFEKNHEFNVSNLSQGLYMVKLESNSNTTTRKLIIN
ncbi:alpha-amylase family glycosyl hydrolase [Gaetbulibacter sp. NE]|uniref:alpha-amylase family glycosyl hydrolase n=1 Tax=Gaetbulibacter sp. NE TaxID=2982307 RepID=UPI0021CF2341|nr:alpha-amylase family glycosyl hydrolase [Gaetbulibacter sp. NE]